MAKNIDNTVSKTQNNGKNQSKKGIDAIVNLDDNLNFIAYSSILILSTLLYYISAKILLNVYVPDTNKAIAFAKEVLCVGGYAPEPIEKILYFLGVFIYIGSFFGFLYVFNKIKSKIKPVNILPIFWTLSSLIIGLLIFICYQAFVAKNPFSEAIQNSHDVMKTNWDFYFTSTFLHNYFSIFTFILFPLLVFLFYRASQKANKSLNILSNYTSIALCGLITVIVFFITAFSFPYTVENKYDFNAVFYSVIQVFHGAPMLVDGFTNTYGLYPHFIVPLLKIFGLSIHGFTIIMAVLLSLCFVFLWYALQKFISNKWLVLFGFTSVFFNCYMYFRIITPYDNVFSMSPIRWILLFSLIFYAAFYHKNKSKISYYLSYFLFSLGILWNPEVGIMCFLTLIAFYCFLDIENVTSWKVLLNWIKHIAIGIGTALGTFILYVLVIKLFYGQFPDLLKLFAALTAFSSIGLGMLPMPTGWHPYLLVASVYLIGLLLSISNILEKKINNKTAFIFVLSALGTLFLVYYIGRSHNWNLFISNPMAFILLTLFADELLSKIKVNKTMIPLFAVVLYCISFSLFQTINDFGKITALITEKENKSANFATDEAIKLNAEFIKSVCSKDEKVILLTATHYQSLYHILSNTTSAFNPGFGDLLLKKDYNRLLSMLQNNNYKVFFEPELFRYTDTKVAMMISAIYELKGTNNKILYLQKRTELKSDKPILLSDKTDVLNNMFASDFNSKVKYAFGEHGNINLSKQFTVEVVFKPSIIPQSIYTQSATIFSNVSGNNGMIFRQNDTIQNAYIFGFSNHGIICKTELGKWNYMVFIVDNASITGIINGGLLGTVPTEVPYQNSKEPLFIGNQSSNPGFYFGDIREIRISNGRPENGRIVENWEKVKALK